MKAVDVLAGGTSILLNCQPTNRPPRGGLEASIVRDRFGLGTTPLPPRVIADNVALTLPPAGIVLLTGDSGSGKSTVLRALQGQLEHVITPESVGWTNRPVVEELELPVGAAVALLTACGLGEPRLMLQSVDQLSEGQRFRFRIAKALASRPAPRWIAIDEFTANLDRPLARVLAFNLRRLADRGETGFLVATTHDDVRADLAPDVHLVCSEQGTRLADCPAAGNVAEAVARTSTRRCSFAEDLWISPATRRDWPQFAGWHYRSHGFGPLKFGTLLRHGDRPIGICLFTTPAASLALRSRYFGLSGRRDRLSLQVLNARLVTLSRVVLHPTYRGAGLGAQFIRRSCQLCPAAWIEVLSQLGEFQPLFERAGFVRLGQSACRRRSRREQSALYGNRRRCDGSERLISQDTFDKSRYSQPVYYIRDNRSATHLEQPRTATGTGPGSVDSMDGDRWPLWPTDG